MATAERITSLPGRKKRAQKAPNIPKSWGAEQKNPKHTAELKNRVL